MSTYQTWYLHCQCGTGFYADSIIVEEVDPENGIIYLRCPACTKRVELKFDIGLTRIEELETILNEKELMIANSKENLNKRIERLRKLNSSIEEELDDLIEFERNLI